MKAKRVLATCPADWQGVRRSITYEADIFVDLACARAAIFEHDPSAVRFGGYGGPWRPLVHLAKQRNCRTEVVLQHTPAFHEFAPQAREAWTSAIEDYKAGIIDELSTPHQGVAATLSQLGVPCVHRRNFTTHVPRKPRRLGPGLHIGILGTGMPWKNMDTQLLAASIVLRRHQGTIHVQRAADGRFASVLGVVHRVHPNMERAAFESLLASMTVNLAIGFTETFGYLPVESFLQGVPCLFSPMTAAFTEVGPDHPLWRCRVDRVDDPACVAERIEAVIQCRDELANAGQMFCRRHVSHGQFAVGGSSSLAEGIIRSRLASLLGSSVPSLARKLSTELRQKPPISRLQVSAEGLMGRVRQSVSSARGVASHPDAIQATINRLDTIREQTDVLALTPEHEGIVWLGVNRASHAIFPGTALELPARLAQSRSLGNGLELLARRISSLCFSQVIFSGFPACTEALASRLHELGIIVGGLYHGFLSECADAELAKAFAAVLRLRRQGVFSKLACNKKGLPETIERLSGIRVHKFMVPTRVVRSPLPVRTTTGPQIGVLGYDILRKNIHNQVAAALMIEGATVHVAGEGGFHYWDCEHRLRRHPAMMPHADYVALLGQMDLNLHLSFSESWGQLAAESLAMGVPCLIANHSDIYDEDATLRELLVSANADDPVGLSVDLQKVLDTCGALEGRLAGHVEILNRRAEQYLREFLAH